MQQMIIIRDVSHGINLDLDAESLMESEGESMRTISDTIGFFALA